MQSGTKIKIIWIVYLALSTGLSTKTLAQQLIVVKNSKNYRQLVRKDQFQQMVEVKTLIPSIVYDLRYATPNNFTGRALYRSGRHTFLRTEAAGHLLKAEEKLKLKGLGFKIFDAYRPYSVTCKMWDLIHDEQYVADPSKGSGHNRGISVDLTLINLTDGKELDMGTGFDNFTDSAHLDFKYLSPQVLANRNLLKEIMEANGFHALSTEWWHYSWPNNRNYEVLDIPFKKLK